MDSKRQYITVVLFYILFMSTKEAACCEESVKTENTSLELKDVIYTKWSEFFIHFPSKSVCCARQQEVLIVPSGLLQVLSNAILTVPSHELKQ